MANGSIADPDSHFFGPPGSGSISQRQGFWRNEGSMNRGMDRGRGLGIDEPFFVIHVRTSKSMRPFKFRTNSGSNSPSSFPKANSKHSIDFEDNTHPAQQPTPQNKQDLCGSWTLWAHVLNIWWEVRGHPTPYPPQPPLHPPHPPPLFPPPAPTSPPTPLISHILRDYFPETVFLNVCGAQELPRNEFRQPYVESWYF